MDKQLTIDDVLEETDGADDTKRKPVAMVRMWLSPGEEVRWITGRSKAIAFVETLRTIGFPFCRYELNWKGHKCNQNRLPADEYKHNINAAYAKYHRLVERHLAAQSA